MTIPSTINKVVYSGNNSQTVYATSYRFLDDGDLAVYLDGVIQTIVSDYSVSGAGEEGGGNVTFVTAPGLGVVITIKNDPPRTQETDYVPNDPFPAESHEKALDKLTLLTQSLGEDSDRTLKFDIDSTSSVTVPEPEADKFLAWNSEGTDLQNTDVTESGSIAIPVPISQGGTGATTNSVARTNLGLGTAAVLDTGTAPAEVPTNADIPSASESAEGLIEIATTAEAQGRTDDTKALTPKKGNDLVAARRVVILAFGTYTSGSYTIPGGRTWADFERVEVVSSASDAVSQNVSGAGIATQEHIAAHPTNWVVDLYSVDASSRATVTATSSTQFTVSRGSNDSVRQVIGVLK